MNDYEGYNPGPDHGGESSAPPAKEAPREVSDLANIESEAIVLGAMMVNNSIIPEISEICSPEDFDEPIHGRIYKTMLKMRDRGVATITPVTLAPVLKNDPAMQQLGIGYLAKLTGDPAVLLAATDSARQVAELAARRKVREALDLARERLVNDWDVAVEEIHATVDSTIQESLERAAPIKGRGGREMLQSVLDRDDEIRRNERKPGIKCRTVSDIDLMTGGLEPATVMYLAGRPGMGKTVCAMSMWWGFAANGEPAEYFHAEMTKEQIDMRLASDMSHGLGRGVQHNKIKNAKVDIGLSASEREALAEVRERVALLPMRSFAIPALNVKRLDAMVGRSCQYWARKGKKLRVVIVDYIQLLEASDDQGRPYDDIKKVGPISSALVRLAKRHDVAVIALCQLGRDVEKRADQRPQMSDLRGSGQLEQDADYVLLLHREEYYLAQTEPKVGKIGKDKRDLYEEWQTEILAVRGQVDLILAKNRHGAARTKTGKFLGSYYAIRGGDFVDDDEQGILL